MEETVSLREILKIIRKRFLLITSLTIISVGIASYLSFYVITPIYEAQTQILVNQKNISQEYSWSQMETDFQLINTYNVIITSPVILNKVIDELDLEVSQEQLTNQIIVSNESDSKVVNITVHDQGPQQAVNIANTIAEVFQAEIPSLMSVDNINILSPAKLNESPSPVTPNITLNIAIAVVIGLMTGTGLAFLREILDTTIKTEKDIEEALQLPVMGLVGAIPLEKDKKYSFTSRKGRGNPDVWTEK
ncbi:YveK family protein [Lysinibacillus sp. LZ02]|uniref:YveK family protein n=1 Tax=Lysinibacillus sp. LZ02 TaxID=3420668 RepID=UPI003D36F269